MRSKVPVNILGGHVTTSVTSDAASHVELWGCESGGEGVVYSALLSSLMRKMQQIGTTHCMQKDEN
jgi:hypothetical protein